MTEEKAKKRINPFKIAFTIFVVVIGWGLLRSCFGSSNNTSIPAPQDNSTVSDSSDCSSNIVKELENTAKDVGLTTTENFEMNMRALLGIWQDIDTQNQCDRVIRGYMLEFFEDALNNNFNAALVHLDEAYNYLDE